MLCFKIMRYILLLLLFFSVTYGFAQKREIPLAKRVIVKTNLLNLMMKRPALTIEKPFSETFSVEFSFVQGEVDDFLLTDHYDYNGFLVRAKKYFSKLDYGRISSYAALYVGNLRRNIHTIGRTDNTGFFSYPSRDISANSIRSGLSIGSMYIGRKGLVIDSQLSLGYGSYIYPYKADNESKGYLDCQVWLSVGYCF